MTTVLFTTTALIASTAQAQVNAASGDNSAVRPLDEPPGCDATKAETKKILKLKEGGGKPREVEFICEEKPSRYGFALPLVFEIHFGNSPTYRWVGGPPTNGLTEFVLERRGPHIEPGVTVAPSFRIALSEDGETWLAPGFGISMASLGTSGLGDRLTARLSGGRRFFTISVGVGWALSNELANEKIRSMAGMAITAAKMDDLPALTKETGRALTLSAGLGVDLAAATDALSGVFAFLAGAVIGK